jgi:hypothetical protein
MQATPRGVMRLAAPLMARTLRRQFAANWDHLRRAMEFRSSGGRRDLTRRDPLG